MSNDYEDFTFDDEKLKTGKARRLFTDCVGDMLEDIIDCDEFHLLSQSDQDEVMKWYKMVRKHPIAGFNLAYGLFSKEKTSWVKFQEPNIAKELKKEMYIAFNNIWKEEKASLPYKTI